MRVIDFIGLGAENVVYVISEPGAPILWRGTRKEFIWEMNAFFLLFFRVVIGFEIDKGDVLVLYI